MNSENPYKKDAGDLKTARAMDKIAKTVFAPIYPLIAEQVRSLHGITSGHCIDIGSGSAALSISLARITDLDILALDPSLNCFSIARDNICDQGLEHRITPVQGRVTNMPFDDNFADLVVSRGSIFFWQDLVAAFNEIYRVLKPGGKTHVGGGFGSGNLKKSIFKQMAKEGGGFAEKINGRMNPETFHQFRMALDASSASQYDITQSDAGFWIHIHKG